MDFGNAYLALGALLALATACAYQPRLFGTLFTPAAGFVGMIASYFVPHTLIVGVLVAIAFGLEGAFAGWPGRAGLVVHLACWIALSLRMRRIHTALPVLDGKPVRDADDPFATEAAGTSALRPGRISWWQELVLRTPAMARAVVSRGVVYREVAGRKLLLDAYRPPEGLEPRPLVLYVHGGGWMSGTRRQSRYLMFELAAAGFPCVSISYRLLPFVRLEAAIEDCKAALAWARAHGREYGGDGRVVVMGGSAGGHLAAMLALTPNEPRFQQGFENADTSVDGAVVFYGVTDFTSAFEGPKNRVMAHFLEAFVVRGNYRKDPEPFRVSQPLTWASAQAPPMLLVHGQVDAIVPIEHSRALAAKLREAGAPQVHLLEVPLAHHAFEVFPTILHQRAVRVVVRFVESLHRGWSGSR